MSREDDIERDRLLTSIDTNLKNFLHLFESHIGEDKESFEKLGNRIGTMEKVIYGLGGALVLVEIIIKFFK